MNLILPFHFLLQHPPYHPLNILLQVLMSMSSPQCHQISMWIWMIFKILSRTQICCINVLRLKNSKNHMITLASSNLNGLQSSHGLRESLLLMAFYTMFFVGLVALLTRNHCCLLPNGIPSWNMKVERKQMKICFSLVWRQKSGTIVKLIDIKKLGLIHCPNICYYVMASE